MRSVLILLSCLSTLALAQPCEKLEFAEMDAMAKEELLRLRCQYHADMSWATKKGLLDVAGHCMDQELRMDRIIARKYQLKGDDHYLEINAMCRRNS